MTRNNKGKPTPTLTATLLPITFAFTDKTPPLVNFSSEAVAVKLCHHHVITYIERLTGARSRFARERLCTAVGRTGLRFADHDVRNRVSGRLDAAGTQQIMFC